MSRTILGWAILLSLFAPSIGAVSSKEAKSARQDTISDPTELAELEKAASRIRELKFQEKVDYQIIDRSSIRDVINARMEEEFPPGKLEKVSLAYAKLGLIEEGVNLREAILGLYSEQIAAFYDQKKRKLYSIQGLSFSREFQKILMSHELTHVLQDQNFDLGTLPLEAEDNDDRALAALSLVEGDATLVCARYASDEASLGLSDILSATTASQEGLAEAPYVIKKNLTFPYMEGVKFVTRLFTTGGWEMVNKAYKEQPQSTEQIMHPDKYMKERDDPVAIVLPDLSSTAGKKWELLEDNVLGELNTKLLFTLFLGSIRAIKPSRGWGGDRFQVYRAEGGEEMILAWGTAWDTEKDREEFVSRYLQAMKEKYKGVEFRTVESTDNACLISDKVVIWLGWQEKKALVLEAPDQPTLLAMIWEFVKAGGGLRITQEVPSAEGSKE
jgi:hypothetical protein